MLAVIQIVQGTHEQGQGPRQVLRPQALDSHHEFDCGAHGDNRPCTPAALALVEQFGRRWEAFFEPVKQPYEFGFSFSRNDAPRVVPALEGWRGGPLRCRVFERPTLAAPGDLTPDCPPVQAALLKHGFGPHGGLNRCLGAVLLHQELGGGHRHCRDGSSVTARDAGRNASLIVA